MRNFYLRPIPLTDPAQPRDGALRLAGGWVQFTHLERLRRGHAPDIVAACDLPEAVLAPFLAPRPDVAGLTLDDAGGDVGTYTLMPVAVEVMPHAVWGPGSGRTRAYVLAGPNLRLPLRLQADESTRFPSRWDVAMDLGVGLDRAFSRFHLAPELRYTYGWANVSQHPAVPEARLHNVTLALQFKG
jgi:hypothetical protein